MTAPTEFHAAPGWPEFTWGPIKVSLGYDGGWFADYLALAVGGQTALLDHAAATALANQLLVTAKLLGDEATAPALRSDAHGGAAS